MTARRLPGETWVSWIDLYYLVVVALVRTVEAVPALRPAAHWLCANAAFYFSGRKRRRIESNLAACFGDSLSPGEQRQITRSVFRETWRELLYWARRDADVSTAAAEVRGLHHLRQALAQGRGAILWESHGFGPRVLAKAVLQAHGLPVCQIHGPNNIGGLGAEMPQATVVRRAVVRAFFDRREARLVAEVVYMPATNSLAYTRGLLERLRQNQILCITGDGRLGQRRIARPLLGRTDYFSTGMISLARLSGAPLLPLFSMPAGGGRTAVTVEPPIRVDPNAGRDIAEAVVARYAALLEERIRQHPGQYRNWHTVGLLPPEAGPPRQTGGNNG